MNQYIIIKGETRKGKVEYQVSDGKRLERTHSYDFTNLKEAKRQLRKLNKGVK